MSHRPGDGLEDLPRSPSPSPFPSPNPDATSPVGLGLGAGAGAGTGGGFDFDFQFGQALPLLAPVANMEANQECMSRQPKGLEVTFELDEENSENEEEESTVTHTNTQTSPIASSSSLPQSPSATYTHNQSHPHFNSYCQSRQHRRSPSSASPIPITLPLERSTHEPSLPPSPSPSSSRTPPRTPSQSPLELAPGPPSASSSSTTRKRAHRKPPSLPVIDHERDINRLSASFINLFTPLLGSHHHRLPSTVIPGSKSVRLAITPRPRLTRNQPHQSSLVEFLALAHTNTHESRARTMSFTIPGQSSFDFGDDSPSTSGAWRGLRRALSLGSSAGSGSRSRRSSRVLSRQLRANNGNGNSVSNADNGSGTGRQGYHQQQISESDIEDDVGRRARIGWENHKAKRQLDTINIGLITSAFGSNGSLPSIATTGTGTATTLSRDREQEAPSGPSSPCDTDRFSLSDWANIPSFPKPPSILPRESLSIESESEAQAEGHFEGPDDELEHELTITIQSPFHPLVSSNPPPFTPEPELEGSPELKIVDQLSAPSHIDASPTDPSFPFNRKSITQSSSLSFSSKPNTPVSVSVSSEAPYCPPSPALTPSPHLSLSNSPVLITPGARPSPSQPSSPLLSDSQENPDGDEGIHNNTPINRNKKDSPINDQTSTVHTIVPFPSSPLTLDAETAILPPLSITPKTKFNHPPSNNLIPPSSSTPPLSSVIDSQVHAATTPKESTINSLSEPERTISPSTSVDQTSPTPLDSPILLRNTAHDIPLDAHREKQAQQQEQGPPGDSMSFGEHHSRQGRERDWAYGNQNTLDPHSPQSANPLPPPTHPFHHKPQPSVPYSTRSISTSGDHPRHSTVDNSDLLSPPPSYGNFSNSSTSSRRNSKLTAFSGSSGSSVRSYSTTDSGSYLGHNQHWHFGERPDISTVLEENSADVDGDYEEEPERKQGNYEFGAQRRIRENSQTGHPRYPTVNTQASSGTLVDRLPIHSRTTPGYFSRERSGTVSSAAGTVTSNQSEQSGGTKPVHPFANAVVRPASPMALPFSKSYNQFLSPQPPRRQGSPAIQNSRSSPNLAETYKMAKPAHQVTLVSTEDDKEDEETCPVCVESLSFTYRLPGEKPHIVPECGHALHEECFVTVYGEVPREGSKKVLGVCGVCRQPMKMADSGNKRDKLAMLMGQPGQSGPKKPSQSAPSVRSANGRAQNTSPTPSDPNADDPLEERGMIGSSRSMRSESSQPKVVIPSISVRSEFPSIARGNRKGKQIITAMVTVEVPPAGDKGQYIPKQRPIAISQTISADNQLSPQLPPSPRSASDSSVVPSSAKGATHASTPDPFAHVVNDLKHRVIDYKTSGLDQLGSLRLFDLLCVRKGSLIREFHVYLFQEALICVSEEKKSGLRGIFSSSASIRSDHSGGSHHGRGVLKLKGRIYVRHVRQVIDTSVPGELSLTITMEDESLDSFILCFKDRSSHETWRSTISRLLEEVKGTGLGEQSKMQRLLGVGASGPRSANASSSAGGSALGMSFGDLASPSTAGYSVTPATSTFTHSEQTPGDLAYEQPLGPVHTPIDLVIVLSLPASTSNGQLPLKVKLMKSSLAFVLALLGPKDRVSLVTCEMGVNGSVRKTPFLSPCRYESRKRLEAFVEILGTGRSDKDDCEVAVGREERFDVVTAVNVALDVVLQRKVKNPISGMVLISDTSDVIKRAQMDLVIARLDAANVPVHALGYGRSHDPSPLWMISNHTHGTYTFVKEWYHLRDSLAGVVGGLMSIAMDNLKLHLSCQDNDFHVTKVSGTTSAIVSKNGKDVDIELRELRHGEIREILVELNLESGDGEGSDEQRYSADGSSESGRYSEQRERDRPEASQHGSSIRKASSFNTDRGLGLDMLSVGDANALRDVVYEDALIDEVPVVEVDCSFHDPGAGRSVARLAHPVLLTVAILPNNAPPSSTPADPMIVRRRMELLASDMITRALLIASRKNFTHASRILRETKRIIETILDGLQSHVSSHNYNHHQHNGGGGRSKKETQTIFAIDGLMGTIQDLDMLLDGLEEHKEMFERDHRNYSAQQAGVLRAQRSWTTRTPTERTYATNEVQHVIQLSDDWHGGRG